MRDKLQRALWDYLMATGQLPPPPEVETGISRAPSYEVPWFEVFAADHDNGYAAALAHLQCLPRPYGSLGPSSDGLGGSLGYEPFADWAFITEYIEPLDDSPRIRLTPPSPRRGRPSRLAQPERWTHLAVQALGLKTSYPRMTQPQIAARLEVSPRALRNYIHDYIHRISQRAENS